MKYIYVVILLLGLLGLSTAQTNCNGILTGTFAGINVNGGACTLSSATVTGSVTVSSSGTLTTLGTTSISGSVTATNSGDILLSGTTTVLGDVSFSDSGSNSITIDVSATIGTLKLTNAGPANIDGEVGSINSLSSGLVAISGTVNGGGVLLEKGNGNLDLCGATISGGITLVEQTGNIESSTVAPCSGSSVTGAISVSKGTGDINLNGVTLTAGDILVTDHTGSISVTGGTFSDLSISTLDGSATFSGTTADSDTTITGVTGLIEILNSEFSGDANINNNAGVTISGSKFGNEVVTLSNNAGPITISNNMDFSISVDVCDTVSFTGNTVNAGSFTGNTGGVTISFNSFASLACSGNSPPPTGTGNNVSGAATGQCSGF